MTLLNLRHVRHVYSPNSTNPVMTLKGITFKVEGGEYVVIMEESGAGKNTLLNIIATLERTTDEQVILNGQDLRQLSKDDAARYRWGRLSFVFQHFNLLDSLSDHDNIYLPLVLAKTSVTTMEERIKPLIDRLRINKIIDRFPSEASGGQQQRITIARASITHPDLLLADEPTETLDPNTSNEILELLDEVNANDQTIVIVTHSTAVTSHAERTLFIKDGRIYHELYRGDLPLKDYRQQISQIMMTLTNDGEW